MEDRISKLESLVTLQDKTIAELNTEVYRQQQDIVALRLRMDKLEKKLEQMESTNEIAGNEKPPHW